MPDISVSIGATNAQLLTVLNDCVARITKLGSMAQSALAPLSKMMPQLAAAIGIAGGFAGVTAAISGVIEKGGQLNDLMNRTGQSGGALLKLQTAFRLTGMEAETVGPAINKLQNALAGVNEDGEDTSNIFARLGLDVGSLKKMDAASQFAALGAALNSLADPADRTSAAMKIFGKSGGEMLQLFNDPDTLSGLSEPLSNSQQLLVKNAALFDFIGDAVESFIRKAKGTFGLFTGITAGLAPALAMLTEKLPKIDLSGIGEQIGHAAALLVAAFSDGKIGELVGLSLKIGFTEAGNTLFSILQGVTGALAAVAEPLGAAFKFSGMILLNMLSSGINGVGRALGAYLALVAQVLVAELSHLPEIVIALKDGLIGAIQLAGALLLDVFQKPIIAFQSGIDYAVQSLLEKLSKIPGLSKMFGLGDGFKAEKYEDIEARHKAEGATLGGAGETAAKLREQGMANMSKAGEGMKDSFKDVDFKAGFAEVASQFKEGMQTGSLFDKKDLAGAAAGVDPASFGAKLKLGYQAGQQGAESPLDDTKDKASLNILANQLSGDLTAVAGKYGKRPENGNATLPADEKEKKEKKEKEDKLGSTGNSGSQAASSLARIGGGGYGVGGALGLQREGNQILKQILTATKESKPSQGLKTGGLLMGHLQTGALQAVAL